VIVAVAGLSWFYPRGRALFYGLALDVAFQRVIRHDHYPSDVIAGALLAVTIVRSVLAASWPGRLIAVMPKPWQQWIFTENKE
jgi:membrane-associated phospholipid phosphatase